MEDNPYSALVAKLREDQQSQLPAMYRMGTVLSAAPLKIDVAGTVQTDESLLKNDALTSFEPEERILLLPIEDEQRYIILCKVVEV